MPNAKKKKTSTEKVTLICHLRIPVNARSHADAKPLQVATKQTANKKAGTLCFKIQNLEDAIDHIEQERHLRIQLNSIKIPHQLNSDLYEAVEDALHDIMYKEYVDPYYTEVRNVLAAHVNNGIFK